MRRPPTARRRLLAALLLTTALVAAAGCGDSDDDAGASPTSDTESASPGPADDVTLRLGVIGNGVFRGPLGYLHDRGELLPLLDGAGVTEIEVIPFTTGPDLNQALVAGELDVASYGDTPALVARASGQETQLIGQGSVAIDAAIVTPKSGGAESLDDLEGEKVAVATGTYMHRYFLGVLDETGVTPGEVVNIPSLETEAALERGDVAAAAVTRAVAESLRLRGYPVISIGSEDNPDVLGTTAIVATESFLADNPDFVAAWQEAWRTAVETGRADWPGYQAFALEVGGYEPEVIEITEIEDLYPVEPFTDDGLELLEGTASFLYDSGFIPEEVDIDEWIAEGAAG